MLEKATFINNHILNSMTPMPGYPSSSWEFQSVLYIKGAQILISLRDVLTGDESPGCVETEGDEDVGSALHLIRKKKKESETERERWSFPVVFKQLILQSQV